MERIDGLTILKMCKAKSFKDLETNDCIDLFDLVECSF